VHFRKIKTKLYKRMKRIKLLTLLLLTSIIQLSIAQTKLQVIRATSKTVDIKEDENLKKGAWIISPEINPDVYVTSAKKVSFYTDISSISFEINPKVGAYNFIILLNEKDSAKTQIKYQPSRLNMLKKAATYNYKDLRFVPTFTYQSKDNPNLVKIRQDFHLDSVVGKGNDVSKILNLMHWVHNTVRHDGGSNNPTLKNAIDLIKVCKSEKRGVNCRMMATILNECYLSLGFKSRYVTCMPKETEFDDCHVINMVYSNDLNKWIWIDPTFDAYVMNEKGELIGLAEVRERLVNDKPLILNPEANWNRENSQTKEDYLYNYMAKNLYRLECPISSEYDTESFKEGKTVTYLELLPLDGLVQTPQKPENQDLKSSQQTKYSRLNYKTNNPNLFWSKPE
jgi:hypothetical protein